MHKGNKKLAIILKRYPVTETCFIKKKVITWIKNLKLIQKLDSMSDQSALKISFNPRISERGAIHAALTSSLEPVPWSNMSPNKTNEKCGYITEECSLESPQKYLPWMKITISFTVSTSHQLIILDWLRIPMRRKLRSKPPKNSELTLREALLPSEQPSIFSFSLRYYMQLKE